ncbi:MAG: PASTA domain-containing protein [Actinomycetota bacterium]|nr:PASTA domain-containing protein [Actinomycetota bacterium]
MQKLNSWVKANSWASVAIALFLGWSAGTGSSDDHGAELASARAQLVEVQSEQGAEASELASANSSLESENSELEQQLDELQEDLDGLQEKLEMIRSERPLPDFVGAEAEDLLTLANKFDWHVSVVKQVSSAAPGTIIGHTPSSGATVRQGSDIQIVVAKAAPAPKPQPAAEAAPESASSSGCDSNYQGTCVPVVSYDLNCDDIGGSVTVVGSDPHGFDADGDGSGCE